MKSSVEFLITSANGKDIFFDPVHSHTATHFADTPGLRELSASILASKVLEGPVAALEVDMGETVGNTDVVMVDDTDEIVYALRKNRKDQGYVPFTKSRETEPSSFVSLHLTEENDTSYELASVWIGEYESPPFPEMANATPESIPYWSKWAFVWGSQEIIPGTERPDCPWQEVQTS